MSVSSAELRGPIETALRQCQTLAAALSHVADSIRARTEDRNEQIDLGVIQRLGGDLECALGELEGLIGEMLGDGCQDSPEDLPIVSRALDFYRDPRSYQQRRGAVPVMTDAGALARAASRALKGDDADGGAE